MTPTEARALADLADGPLFKHTVAVALRSLADQVEALQKEWRPIETVPTTGREPFLLLTPGRIPQVAYTNTWWTSGFSVENKPSHWMPLSPPPPR